MAVSMYNSLPSSHKKYVMIDNYIYLYHTDTYIVLPTFSDSVSDRIDISYSPETPLGRSAPIYSYQHSGPRSIQITLNLHREMFNEINMGVSNIDISKSKNSNYQDYLDYLIFNLQSAAYPRYNNSKKVVTPPVVALKMGKDIFIKGVISGGVNVDYSTPILKNERYAVATIALSINEVDPFSADTAALMGGYRVIGSLSSSSKKNLVYLNSKSTTSTIKNLNTNNGDNDTGNPDDFKQIVKLDGSTSVVKKQVYPGPWPTKVLVFDLIDPQVKYWQKFLNWYYGAKVLDVDGEFGPITLKYTKQFQRKYKLKVDGIVGTETLRKAKSIKK